jgi:hypothetical protein
LFSTLFSFSSSSSCFFFFLCSTIKQTCAQYNAHSCARRNYKLFSICITAYCSSRLSSSIAAAVFLHSEVLLHLALRTWVSGPRYLDLRTWVPRPSQTHKRTNIGHQKLSILRSSYLFPVIFLCVHSHFSFSRHFSLRPVVTDARTDKRLYI